MLFAEYKVERAVEYARKNAFEDGEQKRAQEIARNFKNMGLSNEQIAQGTGLSQDEIKKL